MFAFIRHADYDTLSGALTKDGVDCARRFAKALKKRESGWESIRTSPSTRTFMTAEILGEELGIPVHVDTRIGMEGSIVDLMPPTEPHNIIFVTHLPVLTRMLRSWAQQFRKDEPSLIEICTGYLIDTENKQFILIAPEPPESDHS
jgi:broad specificity phosphatase PhoE